MKNCLVVIFFITGIIFIPHLYNSWNSKHIDQKYIKNLEKYIEAKDLLISNYDTLIKMRNQKIISNKNILGYYNPDSTSIEINASRGNFKSYYLDSTNQALVQIHSFFKDGLFSGIEDKSISYLSFRIKEFGSRMFDDNDILIF